ncbi:hypothetical protein PC116_g6886 [Phytophthora cactorum]|nr:hypothetical protein PC128_g4109 [Phytophthora cactorum]KAG4245302.1 hypothetical protein PC116_g6886 [Phytophthora cactorum]
MKPSPILVTLSKGKTPPAIEIILGTAPSAFF